MNVDFNFRRFDVYQQAMRFKKGINVHTISVKICLSLDLKKLQKNEHVINYFVTTRICFSMSWKRHHIIVFMCYMCLSKVATSNA